MTKDIDFEKEFGRSKKNNFRITKSIAVPHPYCITPKHVEAAADRFMGMLGDECMEYCDKNKIHCGICNKKYNEHGEALIVDCHANFKTDKKIEKELRAYLLASKAKCEKYGFEGFTFVDRFSGEKSM